MRRICSLAVLLHLTAACDRAEAPQEGAPVLVGEVIAAGEYLDLPRQMAVVGDRLVVLDRSAPMAHVFRAQTGEHLGSFGPKGEGPGEFRSATHVQRALDDPRDVWIFDRSLLRMTRLRFGGDVLPAMQEIVNLHQGAGVYLQPVWLSDSTLVVSGIYPRHPEGRLLLTDRAGGAVRGIGEAPRHPGGASIPTTVLQHAYEGPLTVRPDRSRFALATRQADRLEIFEADGTPVARVVGSTGFLPVFETRERAEGVSMATGDDLRVGYVDISSTDRHIYALFSGKTRGEAGANTFFGREVHVFDWSGELVERLLLDEIAFTMAIAPDGRHLFAVRHDPEPAIARYVLPALPGGG